MGSEMCIRDRSCCLGAAFRAPPWRGARLGRPGHPQFATPLVQNVLEESAAVDDIWRTGVIASAVALLLMRVISPMQRTTPEQLLIAGTHHDSLLPLLLGSWPLQSVSGSLSSAFSKTIGHGYAGWRIPCHLNLRIEVDKVQLLHLDVEAYVPT